MKTVEIIVTRRWPQVVEDELQAISDRVKLNRDDHPMSVAEIKDALRSAECVLPTVTDPINAETLGIPDVKCKFLGNFGVGFNHIDVDAAKAAGIIVTNTPEVLTDCTADVAMTLLLMSARRAGEGERHLRSRSWTGWRPTHMLGTKVTGKSLGLVGFGRIATAVAHKAHFGFNMKILFYDPSPDAVKRAADYDAKRCNTLEELLAESDFISLHCPGGDKTYHLIDNEKLACMKPSAYLINTARGDVVDNEALIDALRTHAIAGAGLDVFEGEPDLNPAFLELENVVLFPHLGSASLETRIAMGRRVLENLRAYLEGKPLRDRVV